MNGPLSEVVIDVPQYLDAVRLPDVHWSFCHRKNCGGVVRFVICCSTVDCLRQCMVRVRYRESAPKEMEG
jgi:hypothetical protein